MTNDAKKLLKLILNTIPVRLFWKDRDLKFLGCNRLFAQDAGYQHPEELIGADDLSMVWSEQAEMYRRDDLEVIEAEQPKLQYEEIQTTPDGRTIWLSTSKVPLRDAQDNVIGILGSYEDITQRKWTEEQLKKANENLERKVEQRTLELQETQKQYLHAEKLAAIGKLSASIAHEFNNPLQGILSILKGLRKRAVLEKEDRQLLEAAIAEGDRIKDLIRQLQDFNRPSSGRKVVMDVHQSLNAILLLHKSDFKSKRISVVLDYADQLPKILAVSDQIKQVFLNLLTNAADACQHPGCVITVRTWQENHRVAVAIHDTGIGIKDDEMGLLFQPFYTTKPEVKGTGLGLSVSYGIVKRHNGEIQVTSQPGTGTTFTVLLPIQDDGVVSIDGL
jgi:PAS domain S-box-containing protein